jgi:hypothetical protein
MTLYLRDRFRRMQNRQSIIQFKIGCHIVNSTVRMTLEQTIGTLDD